MLCYIGTYNLFGRINIIFDHKDNIIGYNIKLTILEMTEYSITYSG